MEFARLRRIILLVCCLLSSLAIAGCLGGTDVGNPDGTEVRNLDGTEVEAEEAKERALSAEEGHVTRQLESASCVEGWGLSNYGGIPENAIIENRTADGVYVEVTHPYWYGTEQDEVDGGTIALYLVTVENVQRINGDKLKPC